MPNTFDNDMYADIDWTLYPSKIDSRLATPTDVLKKGTSTVLIPATVQEYNSDMVTNVDYTDYATAGDVTVLQDGIIAIQRTLGTVPQGTFATVKARIEALESMDFDTRYIVDPKPTGWTYTKTRDTVYAHKHNSDGLSGPSKVDLTAEVTNKLPKANIQLATTDTDPLYATMIRMSGTDSRMVQAAVAASFPATAGSSSPITGDLYLNQRLFGGLYAEWDAKDFSATTTTDAATYSGTAASLLSGSSAAWFVVGPNTDSGYGKLRYGKFVVGFRMKLVTDPGDGVLVAKLGVGGVVPTGAGTGLTLKSIYAEDFLSVGSYEMFYVTYDHVPTSGNNKFFFGVYFNGAACNLYVDSVIVTPAHTSVYDD